jgi:MHS family proline/betaine transporter-like MFS transporter
MPRSLRAPRATLAYDARVASTAAPPDSPSTATSAAAPRQSTVRTAFAGLIGNVLEWFDFAVFGYFSSEIGASFFPGGSATAQQLKTFAVFAIGFGARPIGSLVLGPVGDRIGRRALLTLSIALMGGATLALGLLPTYNQVGLLAPGLLVLMRLIQGFSLGGEFTGSMVYTTELASPWMRGLVSSSTAAGTTTGFILGSGTAALLGKLLDAEQKASWGWRVPFIASVLLCAAGWLLRRGLRESEQGEKAVAARPPLWSSLASDWRAMVQTFGIVAMTNAAYYLTFTFAVEYRKGHPGPDKPDFQSINTLILFVVLLAKPLGGWLSDLIGRRRLMIAITIAGSVLLYFGFSMMLSGTGTDFLIGQLLLALPLGMGLGLQGAMVVEIFPLRTRVTSMSLAYSITLVLSGGVAPFIATWLIESQHQLMAPVYYVFVYAVIGLAVMLPMRETNNRSLA